MNRRFILISVLVVILSLVSLQKALSYVVVNGESDSYTLDRLETVYNNGVEGGDWNNKSLAQKSNGQYCCAAASDWNNCEHVPDC